MHLKKTQIPTFSYLLNTNSYIHSFRRPRDTDYNNSEFPTIFLEQENGCGIFVIGKYYYLVCIAKRTFSFVSPVNIQQCIGELFCELIIARFDYFT